jgi:hypothetical protein
LPYPPLEQHGDQERQTPSWRPVSRTQTWRPAPLAAAADELEKRILIFKRGAKQKSFCAAKRFRKR